MPFNLSQINNDLKLFILCHQSLQRILDSSRVEQIYRSLRLNIRKDKKKRNVINCEQSNKTTANLLKRIIKN